MSTQTSDDAPKAASALPPYEESDEESEAAEEEPVFGVAEPSSPSKTAQNTDGPSSTEKSKTVDEYLLEKYTNFCNFVKSNKELDLLVLKPPVSTFPVMLGRLIDENRYNRAFEVRIITQKVMVEHDLDTYIAEASIPEPLKEKMRRYVACFKKLCSL